MQEEHGGVHLRAELHRCIYTCGDVQADEEAEGMRITIVMLIRIAVPPVILILLNNEITKRNGVSTGI